MNHAILLISCPDRKGITAAVTNFVFIHGGNIISADQHIDEQSNTFFMRVEWSLKDFDLSTAKIETAFLPLAKKFSMAWSLYFSQQLPRVAIFVSKHLHCLYDLLLRHRQGQLPCQIRLIISNHADAKVIAKEFGVRFLECPITPQTKRAQEQKELLALKKEKIDMIVLARYHQILTQNILNHFPNRIINIHHSFLPAFAGGDPYRQAYQKGVKIIGATSHYVVRRLDAGPIIEQDTVRVTHRDALADLVRKGQDLERIVLNRAVRWHLQRKILCYNNKTVIFE
ncbi:MAG TPA: formyltetrahydrofolate deformylase [Candidatus Omnitrophota bacterium]|nr:formyltetrahydrofolate deformylase [Candidatus Omnitrophota bacterium]HQL41351.1 formyltetrahydrofolate deformylase [Candidatus Omnitrophota bacterium]